MRQPLHRRFHPGLAFGLVLSALLCQSCSDTFRPDGPIEVAGGTTDSADPNLLPLATGQAADHASYVGRSLTAGQAYADPVTGVTVYKVSDATTPVANQRVVPSYSEGGPHISLPWGANNEMYTLALRVRIPSDDTYFVDFNISTGAFSNWRRASPASLNSGDGELNFSFSNNPATPRIGYYTSGGQVHRFDTGSNANANTGNFPGSLPDLGGGGVWLHQDKHDAWFVVMRSDNSAYVTWNSQTNQYWKWDNGSLDEPHLDRGGSWVWQVGVDEVLWGDLASGPPSTVSNLRSEVHSGTIDGYLVSMDAWGLPRVERYDPSTGTRVWLGDECEIVPSSGHYAGQWVVNNLPGTSQWFLFSGWGTGGGCGGKLIYAIGFIQANDETASNVRLLAHHYSTASDYYAQPHASISPDGKLVLWGSDMGGTSRRDAFIAIVPGR